MMNGPIFFFVGIFKFCLLKISRQNVCDVSMFINIAEMTKFGKKIAGFKAILL